MTTLITGGLGLVGSWLAKALVERGERVVVFARDPQGPSALAVEGALTEVEIVTGDVRDSDAVRRALTAAGADAVFHLAAQTLVGAAAQDPAGTFDVNVRGTWSVLEAASASGVQRVVLASSDKVYGPVRELPTTETQPLAATFPYDASKAAADLLARSYWHSRSLPVATARVTNVYGGGDMNPSRLVPATVWAALSDRAPVIRSDGSPQRDYLYVEDAVRAYLALGDALESGAAAGEAYNAGAGVPHAVLEVVEMILETAGSSARPDIRGAGTPAGELDRQFVDAAKLTALTGWRPQVSLAEGLARTVEWYRRHVPQPPSESGVTSAAGR